MSNPVEKYFELEQAVFFFLLPVIIAAGILYAFGETPQKRGPVTIKLPTAQDVGKKTGEIGTDFGIGIVKGSWKKVKDSLKRE